MKTPFFLTIAVFSVLGGCQSSEMTVGSIMADAAQPAPMETAVVPSPAGGQEIAAAVPTKRPVPGSAIRAPAAPQGVPMQTSKPAGTVPPEFGGLPTPAASAKPAVDPATETETETAALSARPVSDRDIDRMVREDFGEFPFRKFTPKRPLAVLKIDEIRSALEHSDASVPTGDSSEEPVASMAVPAP